MASTLDDKWFKQQKRRAGVTDEDIAAARGVTRANVSNILNGRQRMSLDWAKAFAEVLQVPLATVLEKAGEAEPRVAQQLAPGFAESDTIPWRPQAPEDRRPQSVAEVLGQRPGVDVWRVKGASMVGAGYLPGDYILVDTHAAERVQPGDTAVAQVYARNGTAKTVLRRWMPRG